MKPFIPEDFSVPSEITTETFLLRMLTVHDVIKDYDALMTSVEYLHRVKTFGPKYNWPAEDFTLEQNLVQVAWHQREFQNRTSFAYTVMNLDESKCLGCVYISPSPNSEYDAEITMWVRQSEAETGLDDHLFSTVKEWIAKEWPFKKPGYPGKDIDWEEWNSLELN